MKLKWLSIIVEHNLRTKKAKTQILKNYGELQLFRLKDS